MILNKIREFIKTNCPLVSDKGIQVNFLGEMPQSYAIENVPVNPVVRKYPDGGSLRQCLFVFASREFHDAQALSNQQAADFYQAFADWVEETNRMGTLPCLGDGLCSLKLEVLKSGFLENAGATTARYEITCRLLYEKEGVF